MTQLQRRRATLIASAFVWASLCVAVTPCVGDASAQKPYVKNADGSTTTTDKDDTVVAGGTKETTRDEQGHVTKEEFKDPKGNTVRVIHTSYPPGGKKRVDQIDFDPKSGTPTSTSMTLTDADGNVYSEHFVFKDSVVSGGEAEVKDTKGKKKYFKFNKTTGEWKEFHPEQWGGEWYGSWLDYALRDIEPFDSKGETGSKRGTAPKTGTDPKAKSNALGTGTSKDIDSSALELYKALLGEAPPETPDGPLKFDGELMSNPFTPDDFCCEAGVQKLGLIIDVVVTVASPPLAATLPLAGEWLASRGRLAGGAPLASGRTPWRAPVASPTPPPREVWLAPFAQGSRASGAPITAVITSLGTSQGEAFQVQLVNDGPTPVRLSSGAIVVEPLKRAARHEAQKALRQIAPRLSTATSVKAEGYCLNYALKPPDAGMLFRIAPSNVQAQFAPVRSVLRAAATLSRAGRLTPDTNARTYVESIKQYAVWTKLERWTQPQFADAWVGMTKRQMASLKRPWTAEMETALRGVVPGRWRDIQAILTEADSSRPRADDAGPR